MADWSDESFELCGSFNRFLFMTFHAFLAVFSENTHSCQISIYWSKGVDPDFNLKCIFCKYLDFTFPYVSVLSTFCRFSPVHYNHHIAPWIGIHDLKGDKPFFNSLCFLYEYAQIRGFNKWDGTLKWWQTHMRRSVLGILSFRSSKLRYLLSSQMSDF